MGEYVATHTITSQFVTLVSVGEASCNNRPEIVFSHSWELVSDGVRPEG